MTLLLINQDNLEIQVKLKHNVGLKDYYHIFRLSWFKQ